VDFNLEIKPDSFLSQRKLAEAGFLSVIDSEPSRFGRTSGLCVQLREWDSAGNPGKGGFEARRFYSICFSER